MFQAFVVDPGQPPRTGTTLRAYLRLWVAPAVESLRPRPVGQLSSNRP